MDQDQQSNNSDGSVSGENSGRSALSSYLRAIRANQEDPAMNPSLTLKKTSSSPFVKSSQVSNSVKDIQGMFSSFKPSPSRVEGRERTLRVERGDDQDNGNSHSGDYRKTFVHAKFSTRIGQKYSMDEEEGRDRSFENSSNLRRFSSATQMSTSTGGSSTNVAEIRNNVLLERHSPRRQNFHRSPNLPIGLNVGGFNVVGASRNVQRLENSEDDTEDDTSSIVSKNSNENESFAFCSNSTVNSSTSNPSTAGVTVSAPTSAVPRTNNVKETLNSLSSSATPSAPSSRSNSEDMGSARKYSTENNSVSAPKPAVPAKPPVPSARLAPVSKPPPEATEKPEVSRKLRQLDGYVGFANMPNQVYRKAVKRGFEFTLMVVGESGLGKSTLINSMFLTDIYSPISPGPSARIKKTVAVETNRVLLKESGVNLKLTIVDTPGFGDAIDNSKCWDPVINFVESRYEEFLDAETRVNRVPLPDTRVHACLYFIAPSGHGLKPLDAEFMRRLHDKVNIIPVIAKADTLTPEEIVYFKDQIMRQISQAGIKIYDFPDESSFVFEEKDKKEIKSLKSRVPFAVVGSNTLIEPANGEGKRVRGRKYPWGVVDIENMEHCDFVPLRNMLIRTYLQDLKEVTNNVLYENFRCRKLAGVAGTTMDKIPNKNPLATIEEERREHQAKMTKMEKEMEEVFERKVREKKNKLNDSEIDLEKRHRESKEKLDAQKRELEAQRAAFLEEKNAWEAMNGITIDELKRLSMESLDGGKKKKSGALSGVSFRMGR